MENYKIALDNFDFNFCDDITDIDEVVVRWSDSIIALAKGTIPNREVMIRPLDKPWFDSSLRKLLRKKKRLHTVAKKFNTTDKWVKFKNCRNLYNKECQRQKKMYEANKLEKLIESSGTNPKKWWSLLKTLANMNTSMSIAPLINDGIVLYDDVDKCEVFNTYFNKICTNNDIKEPNLDFGEVLLHSDFNLNLFTITEEDVKDQLKILNTNKAYGCDSISPHFIKVDNKNVIKSLCNIFNFSLKNGKFPDAWKRALVLP